MPGQLTIKPVTYVTVRISEPLSSDHNQPGDPFSATLVSPLVVDGIVVAQRGQMVAGWVVQAQKAGRVEGVSRLGIELTQLTLVDDGADVDVGLHARRSTRVRAIVVRRMSRCGWDRRSVRLRAVFRSRLLLLAVAALAIALAAPASALATVARLVQRNIVVPSSSQRRRTA